MAWVKGRGAEGPGRMSVWTAECQCKAELKRGRARARVGGWARLGFNPGEWELLEGSEQEARNRFPF